MMLITYWSNLSLSARILIGLGLGIFAGLFFGEPAAVLQPIADIYIRLMQMTVLPYLVTSLVVALGSLSAGEARRLALYGGLMLLLVWALTILVLVLMPLSFPQFASASFFSQSLVEPHAIISLTDIYFTSNPFASLSQNVVPAVVLFSCLIGIALIRITDKEKLISPLRIWSKAIVRITGYVINLTPYGVFAIGAATAGTMEPETFLRLEVYFISFAVAAMLLAFVILPFLVTAVTPFSYKEVSSIARDALLTAFVAHSAFIVLPILVERSKVLLERHGLLNGNTDSATEVLIPVMFNFPNAGKLLTLLFIPFSAWLAGAPFEHTDYPSLMGAGIPSYFAKAQVALPFLLDFFSLPQDLFQLYIPTTVVTGKFDSLVTAMNLLVFALLGACAFGGYLVFERARILRAAAGILGSLFVSVLILKIFFAYTIDTSYTLDSALENMHQSTLSSETIVHRDTSTVLDQKGSKTTASPAQELNDEPGVLARIKARGTLRIGYDPHNLPMSFFNANDELVGFDIDLAERMAQDLNLRAEFVPISWPKLPAMLDEGTIDIMPGIWYRPYWFSKLKLSDPYFVATMGLALRDNRRGEFDTLAKISKANGLKIGVPLDIEQISDSIEHYFGGTDATLRPVEFWNPYFEGEHSDLDAFLMPAEHASAWSLLHPEYSVVVPQPNPVRMPTGYAVALGTNQLVERVNEWVLYAEKSGLVNKSYDYWVTGKGAEKTEPRWSIMRNVLGWGE